MASGYGSLAFARHEKKVSLQAAHLIAGALQLQDLAVLGLRLRLGLQGLA